MSTMGDLNPTETGEWIDALGVVRLHRGSARTNYLLNRLVDEGGTMACTCPARSIRPTEHNPAEEKSSGSREI